MRGPVTQLASAETSGDGAARAARFGPVGQFALPERRWDHRGASGPSVEPCRAGPPSAGFGHFGASDRDHGPELARIAGVVSGGVSRTSFADFVFGVFAGFVVVSAVAGGGRDDHPGVVEVPTFEVFELFFFFCFVIRRVRFDRQTDLRRGRRHGRFDAFPDRLQPVAFRSDLHHEDVTGDADSVDHLDVEPGLARAFVVRRQWPRRPRTG